VTVRRYLDKTFQKLKRNSGDVPLDSPPPTSRRAWICIGLFAVLCRYGYIYHLHPPNSYIGSDMLMFVTTAVGEFQNSSDPNLSLRQGLLTRHIALGLLHGSKTALPHLLQLFWSAGSAFLTYAIARRFLSERLALLAFLIQSCNVLEIALAGYWLAEASFGFLTLALIWSLLRWKESEEKKSLWVMIAGILFAGQFLSRDNAIFALPLILLWIVFGSDLKLWAQRLKYPTIFLLTTVLVLAPCSIRNRALIGSWYPGSTRGSLALYLSMSAVRQVSYSHAQGSGVINSPTRVHSGLIRPITLAERAHHYKPAWDSHYWRDQAFTAYARQPQIALINLQNFFFMWWLPPWPSLHSGTWEQTAAFLWNGVFALTIFPLYLMATYRRRTASWYGILNLVLISHFLVIYLSFGQSRFRVPYDPLYLILALTLFNSPTPKTSVPDNGMDC
jgi:4-amino-4-deoxy-L-arabinose transferase-like glycosyltransferase